MPNEGLKHLFNASLVRHGSPILRYGNLGVSSTRIAGGRPRNFVIEGTVTPSLMHKLCSDPKGRSKAHSFEGPIAFEECYRHLGHNIQRT